MAWDKGLHGTEPMRKREGGRVLRPSHKFSGISGIFHLGVTLVHILICIPLYIYVHITLIHANLYFYCILTSLLHSLYLLVHFIVFNYKKFPRVPCEIPNNLI